jgi:peptidoglycan/LPS O-acetylase OafA/YrhL
VLIAIAVATLFYRWFERPVLHGLRAVMDGRPPKAATAGSTA